ncbi:MAG: hypothetical protein ACKO9Q_10365 [Pirellula sp.]
MENKHSEVDERLGASNDGIAVLYDRAIGDLLVIQDLIRFVRLGKPADSVEDGPKGEKLWAMFDDFIDVYQKVSNRFDESFQLDREIRRQPHVEDAKIYLEKGRVLCLNMLKGLFSGGSEGRTVENYLAKVDESQEITSKYGFTLEEIEAIGALVENLRAELALISVSRKKARWTQLEKDVQKLNDKRKSTRQILNALRPQYPSLTWEIVRSMCNKNPKRAKRGNKSK